jgi:Heterokaryon incompatibility protein (HET)
MQDFVQEDSQGRRIRTTFLNVYIAAWPEQINSLALKSPEECRVALTRIAVCLNTVHKICGSLSTSPDSPVPREVVLSFSVLGCTIDHALEWFWKLGRGRNWDLNTIAAAKMMQSGWCPRDIAVARFFLSEIPMFCTSYMARPSVPQDHWYCSEMTCAVNQVNELAYVTKHRMPECRCCHIQSTQEEIRKILDRGDFPIVSLTPRRQADGSRTFDLKIKAGNPLLSRYIAISHVWSDGLGNPNQNSLPLCQLEFLYDLLVDTIWDEFYMAVETMDDKFDHDDEMEKKVSEGMGRMFKAMMPVTKGLVTPIRNLRGKPLSIWIDTLCVPLEKQYRKVAIAGMKNIYAKANYTLVLDSELASLRYRACSPEELLVRVGLSGWMRRAWTFQEGVLANIRMRMLFADGIFELPLGRQRLKSENTELDYVFPRFASAMHKFETNVGNWADRHGVERPSINPMPMNRPEELQESRKTFTVHKYMLEDAKSFFGTMMALWARPSGYMQPSDQVDRIIAAWNGLRRRATSREDDRFICFAVACVRSPTDQARIQDLLTHPPEQRMKAWIQQQAVVPSGFLFIGGPKYKDPGFRWAPVGVSRELLEDAAWAVREQGTDELLFRKSGFILDAMGGVSETFLISDQMTSLRYSVRPDWASIPAEAGLGPHQTHGTLGIIMTRKIGHRRLVEEKDFLYQEVGVLLGDVQQVGDKVYGNFMCRVEVQLVETESNLPKILAQEKGDDQAWIIS